MNAEQMAAALKAFGSLIGGGEGAALNKFAQLFDGMGEAKAAEITAQIARNWKSEGRSAKRPVELERAVRRIGEVLASTGAKAQAGVFAKVLPILAGSENQDVGSFLREAIEARVKKAPPPKPPKVAKPKFADLAPELAKSLTAVACDRGRFDALLKVYNERYKTKELKAIADHFMGFDVDLTKKKDIVKAVRNWQREEELDNDSHASQAKAGL